MPLTRDEIFNDQPAPTDPYEDSMAILSLTPGIPVPVIIARDSYAAIANLQGSTSAVDVAWRDVTGPQKSSLAVGASLNIAPIDGKITFSIASGTASVNLAPKSVTPSAVLLATESSPAQYAEATTPSTVAVSTTVLKALGATNWTGADASSNRDRSVVVTNCGATDLYARTVAAGASAVVSASDYEKVLGEGESKGFYLKVGQELQLVRATGSGNVVARRFA